MQNKDRFSLLPDEMCLSILQYLLPKDLCKCMCVCRRWKELCSDETLWHTLDLLVSDEFEEEEENGTTGNEAEAQEWTHTLKEFVTRHRKLKSLVLNGKRHLSLPVPPQAAASSDMDERVRRLVPECVWANLKHLERIAFVGCPRVVSTSFIPRLLSECPKLTRFACEVCENVSEFSVWTHLIPVMSSSHRRFRELSLAHCTVLDDFSLFDALRHSSMSECVRTLHTLNLDGVLQLSDSGVVSLLSKCPGLKSLSLDGEELTDRTISYVGANCSGLTHLSVSFCSHLTDESLQSLESLRDLEDLRLKKGHDFGEGALLSLFEHLASPSEWCQEELGRSRRSNGGGGRNGGKKKQEDGWEPNSKKGGMRKLFLIEFNQLGDAAAHKLSECFPHLQLLDLSWPSAYLTDAGLESIVKNCNFVTSLNLTGAKRLQGYPLEHAAPPCLTTLELVYCDLVDDDVLLSLKQRLPHLTITDYYGECVAI